MLPQHLTYGEGGLVYIDLQDLPTAVTVSIEDDDGTEQLAHTAANVSTIDTTVAANCSMGATSFTVAANTGLEVGAVAYIQDDPEEILVRKVEGTTVYLRRPLLHDHILGADVEGSRAQYQVNAAVANTLWWDGRCEWNISGGKYGTKTLQYTAVECGKYPLDRMASAQDLYDLEPKLYDILDSETDVERLLDLAHQHVLKSIAKASPDRRARVFTGSMEFRTATALAALYIHYRRRGGDDARDMADRYKTDLQEELDAITGTTPRDADQGGSIESDELMSMGTVRLRRG